MDLKIRGFTDYDLALLVTCTIGGVIGSFAQTIVATIHPGRPPRKNGMHRLASLEPQ